MKEIFTKIFIALACVMALAPVFSVHADDYPSKPIVNIVAWAPGGSTDISARLFASFMPKYLGQAMVTENQAGGATLPGTLAMARARPDGYTVGVNWAATWTIRPFILDVPYTMDDFTFIIGIHDQETVLFVRKDSPFKTFEDLIKHIKANPGKLNYGGGVTGSFQHLLGAFLNFRLGVDAEYISQDGNRPTTIAVLGGQLDYAILDVLSVAGELKTGAVRPLVCFQKERIKEYPDTPTIKELGYEELILPQSMMMVGPKGIPADRVKILHDAFKRILEDPEFLKLGTNVGMNVSYRSGEECRQDIANMIKVLTPVIDRIFPDSPASKKK